MSEGAVTTPEPTATPPATPETPPAAPAASWRDGLDPEMRDNPNIAKFDDVPALVKSHLEAVSLIGKKGIIKLGDNPSDDERATYFNSLGRPETVDGYELNEFEPPESIKELWDAEGMNEMSGVMHELGLTKTQASGLIAKFAEHQADQFGATMEGVRAGKGEASEALKEKWGLAYDGNLDLARRTITQAAEAVGYSPEDLAGAILPDGSMVGNSPVLTEIFALIGKGSSELKFLGGKGSGSGVLTPAEADSEIAKLQAHEGYLDSRHPEHAQIMRKFEALHLQRYPEEKE